MNCKMNEGEAQETPKPSRVTNIYGNINNYNVYQAPVTYNAPTTNTIEGEGKKAEGGGSPITIPVLRDALEACRKYIWGQSAYGVIFSVVRDKFDYKEGMSQFERNVQAVDAEVHLAFACPEGTIAQAFYNNKFLKYNVDSWDEFKMLERVPRLVGKFREAVNRLIGRVDSIEEKE